MALGKADGATTPLTGQSPSSPRHIQKYAALAPILAICSCVLFSCNGELLQFLQLHASNEGHVSPMLNLILCHLGGLLFVPHFLFWKPSGYSQGMGMNVQMGSLLMAILLMSYNYCFVLSARLLSVGLTNAIFQTSVAFVFIASILIFREDVDRMQICGVALALGGSFLASGGESSSGELSKDVHTGIFLALCAALLCMVYQVLFKYLFGHFKGDARFLAHIGAWVSVWHLIVIFPLACLASAVGIETMHFPHGHLMISGTMASAIIASTVNAMYICMVMWGSSMLLPCASALSVPVVVCLDIVFHHVVPARAEACGHLMVVMSVVLIMRLHKEVIRYARPKPVLRAETMAP